MNHGSGQRKGQTVFEFIIATLFFLAIVMYVISFMNTNVNMYAREHGLGVLESRAWQASEALVRTEGNWSGSSPNMIPEEPGLAQDWPVLDTGKLLSMDNFCSSGYEGFLRAMDVDPEYHGMSLVVDRFDDPGETRLVDCGTPPQGRPYAEVKRAAVSDTGKLLRIRVGYW